MAFLALVLYVPFLQKLFLFEAPRFTDLLICLAAGAGSITWFEAIKVIRSWRK
jgi:hypothetical protein